MTSPTFHTRRKFLQSTVLGGALTWTLPSFVLQTIQSLQAESLDKATQIVTGKDGNILVVIQLAGGNDGLSTLVPYTNDFYFKARPTLALNPTTLYPINDTVGLHPNLTGFQELFQNGNLAIVQGVGYPNPNRSHFRSTEIWHTASDSNQVEKYGWLGRYFDHACNGADPSVGVNVGNKMPQAFACKTPTGVSLSNPNAYRFIGTDRQAGGKDSTEAVYRQLNKRESSPKMDDSDSSSGQSIGMLTGALHTEGSSLDFLERTALDAEISSDTILAVTKKIKNQAEYPQNSFATNLSLIARLIGGGMPTRVFYTAQGGFDTHTGQRNSHDRLMLDLGSSLQAFCKDLKAQGNFNRVTILTFSEFGRRVQENGNQGTDHGAAAPLFVMGGKVKGGLYGKYPSLTPADLNDGDLTYNVDFRSLYSGLLEQWLNTPSTPILGKKFEPLSVLA